MKKNVTLEDVKGLINKVTSTDYSFCISEESLGLIKDNEEFMSYLLNTVPERNCAMYAFMNELIKIVQPKHMVELGNREGLGVISCYEAFRKLPDAMLTTVDIVNDLRFVPEHIKSNKQVNFIFGDVLDGNVLNQVKEHGAIDILYLDTIHTAEQFEAEWNLYKPLLSSNAIVLVDDIYYETKHVFWEKIECEKFVDMKLHASGFGIILYCEK